MQRVLILILIIIASALSVGVVFLLVHPGERNMREEEMSAPQYESVIPSPLSQQKEEPTPVSQQTEDEESSTGTDIYMEFPTIDE
jgi:hypothetical protein